MQPILIQAFTAISAALVNLSQALRHLIVRWTIRSKRGRLCHLGIPMPGPDAVSVTQPRRPGKHRLVKVDAGGVAEQPQNSFRIFQHVLCIDNGWNRFRPMAEKIEDLYLLHKPEILDAAVLPFLDISR